MIMKNFQFPISNFQKKQGFTLIELVVSVGLFALIMTLAAGSYLIMIGVNRHVQGITTGIDNLAFALETMTRSMRTGTTYDCGVVGGCPSGTSSFTFKDAAGTTIVYSLVGTTIYRNNGIAVSPLTDPSVTVTSLTFYSYGTSRSPADYEQSRVTMIVSGTISSGPGKTEPFTVETGATMRGSDI
jgi:prepilin-type N-terminal cleavage/methylation domain-containing protein